jgi:hypothetical protein
MCLSLPVKVNLHYMTCFKLGYESKNLKISCILFNNNALKVGKM